MNNLKPLEIAMYQRELAREIEKRNNKKVAQSNKSEGTVEMTSNLDAEEKKSNL